MLGQFFKINVLPKMNLLNILLQQIRQFLWKKLPYLPYNRSFNRCISRKWREKNDVLLVKPSCFIAFLKMFPSNTHVRRVYWTLSYRHLVERSSNQCYFMPVRHEKQNAMDAQNVWRYSCCVPMSYFQTWLSQNALLRDRCIQSRENSDHMDNPTALKLGRNVLYVIA